ncbi:zinc knuckle CX2CX4HX4C containing protein [Tanacetum coccineum]
MHMGSFRLEALFCVFDTGLELPHTSVNIMRPNTVSIIGNIICKSIQADNTNTNVTPYKVSHVDPTDQSVDVPKSTSYIEAASAHSKDQPEVNSNFCPLVAEPVFEGVNISIPCKMVEKVSTHFEHTLYGYFIGKRIAFSVVEYYTKSNWAKHGLKRVMMNSKGFFFFKFDTRVSLEAVLEGGFWLIHKSPVILKKWSMDTRLLKEELTRIPVWVKLHDVPIQVFEEDGISLIATFIGKPVMLNSYTSSICKDSWGRSSFARCKSISLTGGWDMHTKMQLLRVWYEWKPPRRLMHVSKRWDKEEEEERKILVLDLTSANQAPYHLSNAFSA